MKGGVPWLGTGMFRILGAGQWMPDYNDLNRDELRRLATSENVINRLVLANSGWAPWRRWKAPG